MSLNNSIVTDPQRAGVKAATKGHSDTAGRLTDAQVQQLRKEFPLLQSEQGGKPLVYLDNGATTQKPQAVLDRLQRYYSSENANIHRGIYQLSQTATHEYEQARKAVARFLNVGADDAQVIFTRGATEAINLVAAGYGKAFLHPGDQVIVSAMEHHSNIVPWQIACAASGAELKVIPINDAGELLIDRYEQMLNDRTRMVAFTHLSNALGTVNDAERLVRLAHQAGAKVLVDGAQWVAHFPTDVQALGCDFYVFSGHKIFGPTGIGVLYGRRELLEALPPYQSGGDMIETVTFERTTYAPLPNKFEAGTPHIAGAVGLAAALEFVESIGFDRIVPHEEAVFKYAHERLLQVPGLRLIGNAAHHASVLSFVIDDPPISTMDVGSKLDEAGIAIRTGHHCCQPVMDRLGIPGTARASLSLYNTKQDVDALVSALEHIVAAARQHPAHARAAKQTIDYPQAAGGSPQDVAAELAETFDLLDDRAARNEYLLDLGEQLPDLFETLKTVTPRIPGCMSEVYLVGRQSPGQAEVLEFVADANADIVRGLVAVLQRLFSGQPAQAVLDFDIEAFFSRIQLDQFVTSQRRNGLAGMVQRIHQLAAHVLESAARGEGAGKSG